MLDGIVWLLSVGWLFCLLGFSLCLLLCYLFAIGLFVSGYLLGFGFGCVNVNLLVVL